MPIHRSPFDKGTLIVKFMVEFPDKIDPNVVAMLENCLPPKPSYTIPMESEEVDMIDYAEKRNNHNYQNHHGNYATNFNEMVDDEDCGSQRVQCATN